MLISLAVSGFSIVLSGCVIQSILSNPLADPFLVGVSSFAVMGSVIGSIIGFSPLMSGFVFSVISMLLIVLFINVLRLGVYEAILAGVIMNLFAIGTTAILLAILDPYKLYGINLMFSSFVKIKTLLEALIYIVLVISATILFTRYSGDFDAMSFGDFYAKSLDVDLKKTLTAGVVIVSILAAVSIALTGIIGFVGVLLPHIGRRLYGAIARNSIFTALVGSILLIFSHFLIKLTPFEIPLGSILFIFGIPAFVYIVKSQYKGL